MVSERGTLGEVNLSQATVCCTMRPVLVALGIEHRTITRLGKTEFIGDPPDPRGGRDAGAGPPDPVAAANRREQVPGMSAAMDRLHNALVMNRAVLTRRLVATLTNQAVIGRNGGRA
jgi:hypothetical protein